jgi:hypothetical protein
MGCYSSKGALNDDVTITGILGDCERSDESAEDRRKARFLRVSLEDDDDACLGSRVAGSVMTRSPGRWN